MNCEILLAGRKSNCSISKFYLYFHKENKKIKLEKKKDISLDLLSKLSACYGGFFTTGSPPLKYNILYLKGDLKDRAYFMFINLIHRYDGQSE